MANSFLKQVATTIAALSFILMATIARAQDKIEVDTGEVKSWLEQNWMWLAGGAVLLLLIMLLSRGNRTNRVRGSKRTTTVIKDAGGHTKSVTTTEEKF